MTNHRFGNNRLSHPAIFTFRTPDPIFPIFMKKLGDILFR